MKTEELNLNKGENGWVGVTYSQVMQAIKC